jgi:exonuclease III
VHDWLKIETLEGIFARLAGTANGVPRVLCGDFNTPRAESVDGTVLTWGQTETGRTRIRLGERWDAGERNILVRLADFDLADAFRSVHGYAVQAYSYRTNNRGRRTPRRFDHAFASASLAPVAARYVNAFADAWLSDHAPLIVDFAG